MVWEHLLVSTTNRCSRSVGRRSMNQQGGESWETKPREKVGNIISPWTLGDPPLGHFSNLGGVLTLQRRCQGLEHQMIQPRSLPRKCCDSALGMFLNDGLCLGCIQTSSVNLVSLKARGVMPLHLLPSHLLMPLPPLTLHTSYMTGPPPLLLVEHFPYASSCA